jgi:hypothetical protein
MGAIPNDSQAGKIYPKARGRARLARPAPEKAASGLPGAVLVVDAGSESPSLGPMSDEIIDLTQYLNREQNAEDPSPGVFALWGADGERSRFALPLWRIIYLAEGERGALVWREESADEVAQLFLVLDLAQDPARLEVDQAAISFPEDAEPPALHDFALRGVTIFLGSRAYRSWYLVVDGGDKRIDELTAKRREDILFLAGECAGLLFLRDFADGVS